MIAARVRFVQIGVVLGVIAGAAAGAFAGDAAAAKAGGTQAGWERLNLAETTLAGTKVYYEKVLEPNLPAFERGLTRFLAGRDKLTEFVARRQEIIADINRILGATDPNTEMQTKALVRFATMFAQVKVTFYVARSGTIKDFLRSGGQLPNFSYDRASDVATYNPRINVPEGAAPPETYDFCIPILPDREFSQYVASVFDVLREFTGPNILGLATHEVTEMTLVRRARPTDAYWRWFSDGVANVITIGLLEKYVGKEAAEQFAHGFDPNEKQGLADQVNLRYWMLANYCVYTTDGPVKAESQMERARYAYATTEVRRLIDAHGIGCIRDILDRIVPKERRDGSDLLQVVKEVTGEDMESRLARYQTFETREQGLKKYGEAFKAASAQDNSEQMFVNVVRAMELRGSGPSFEHLKSFLNAALLLHRMGHDEAVDTVMQRMIELYSQDSVVNGRYAAAEAFVFYALNCDQPQKARKMADEVLQRAPEHVPSLVVKMLVSRDEANMAEARKYAAQVCRLAENDSKAYRVASEVLAADPNQPSKSQGPAEPK